MERVYDISGLTATPIRNSRSWDDVEYHDRKMNREEIAALIVGGFPTPNRYVTSFDRMEEHHDGVSIIVISNNPQILDHPLLTQHQQRSSSEVSFPGKSSSIVWLLQKCRKWKRKLSMKLKKKSAHGVNGNEGALGRIDMYTVTEPKSLTDIETGPEVYIEAGMKVDMD